MNELINWEVLWLINGNMQILTYFVAFVVCFSFLSLIGLMDHLFDKKQTQEILIIIGAITILGYVYYSNNLSNRVKKFIGTDYVQLHENKDENIKILLCYKNIYNIKTTDECNKIINDYKNYKKEQHDELMKKYEQEKIEQNNIDKINKSFNL